MPDLTPTQQQILLVLRAHAASFVHLQSYIDISADQLASELEAMERNGLIITGPAWFGINPEPAITIYYIGPLGRGELARIVEEPPPEPVVLTRAELLDELERRGGRREILEMDPSLRAERFHFWPSISAYAVARDGD